MTVRTHEERPVKGALVPGVSPDIYGQADFARISQKVRSEAGIVLDDTKRMLVYSRIAPLVRASGTQTFAHFLNRVDADRVLATKMVGALTTNHTYFNREPHHFEHFAAEVRPHLVERAEAGEPVRLWSAGCSSGEELWTLLMTLLGPDARSGETLAKRDVVALASDLADHAVKAAQAAVYPASDLDAVPASLRSIWCHEPHENGAGMLAMREPIRSLARFRQLNLLAPWPFNRPFDVIFCRNVMIYFDQPSKERLVLSLAQQLRQDGHLYIGHSERVAGEAAQLLEPVGPTVYRRCA